MAMLKQQEKQMKALKHRANQPRQSSRSPEDDDRVRAPHLEGLEINDKDLYTNLAPAPIIYNRDANNTLNYDSDDSNSPVKAERSGRGTELRQGALADSAGPGTEYRQTEGGNNYQLAVQNQEQAE